MIERSLLIPAAVALALAACQQAADDGNIAIDESANAAGAEIETLPPSETSEAAAPAPRQATIPAQYHGRWGMVAADCTSTRGDAKGLIVIGERDIRFFEATATLVEQRPAIATGFAGFYRFTGEGQNWEKVVTLKRSGDRLTRTDDAGNTNYKRC